MPKYTEEARLVLRGVLTACRHILAETCTPMAGSSDGKDLLPEMLRGSAGAKSPLRHGSADLSGFHVALLWVGSSVAAVGELLSASLADKTLPMAVAEAKLFNEEQKGFACCLGHCSFLPAEETKQELSHCTVSSTLFVF